MDPKTNNNIRAAAPKISGGLSGQQTKPQLPIKPEALLGRPTGGVTRSGSQLEQAASAPPPRSGKKYPAPLPPGQPRPGALSASVNQGGDSGGNSPKLQLVEGVVAGRGEVMVGSVEIDASEVTVASKLTTVDSVSNSSQQPSAATSAALEADSIKVDSAKPSCSNSRSPKVAPAIPNLMSHSTKSPPVAKPSTSRSPKMSPGVKQSRAASKSQYVRTPMQVPQATSRSVSYEESGPVMPENVCAANRANEADHKTMRDEQTNIYDQPSLTRSEKGKPLTEMFISDGYIKLRTATEKPKDVDCDLQIAPIPSASSGIASKPVVTDVKRVPRCSADKLKSKLRTCKSTNAIDRVELLLDADDEGAEDSLTLANRLASLRSTFVDPNGPPTRCSVYIELGEYQTMLKHSRRGDAVYSLPQPQCYGEDTLRAVRLITEKYDTFQRLQQRARSFRSPVVHSIGGDRRVSRDESAPQNSDRTYGVIAEESKTITSRVSAVDAADGSCESRDVTEGRCYAGESGLINTKGLESMLLRDYFTTPDHVRVMDAIGGISRLDRMRVEMFYRSRDASVFVASALADLSTGATGDTGATAEDGGESPVERWTHEYTGVPVWLLNTGGAGIRRRELILVLAERETGLPLWQDKINYLSNYRELDGSNSCVHTLSTLGRATKTVKLSVYSETSAQEFVAKFRSITADPDDDLWMISEGRGGGKRSYGCRRAEPKARGRRRRHEKSSISQPCNFVHVTHIDNEDANFRSAFGDLLPSGGELRSSPAVTEAQVSKPESTSGDSVPEFRPRLPTS